MLRLSLLLPFSVIPTCPGPAQCRAAQENVGSILTLSEEYGSVFAAADLEAYPDLLTEDAIVLGANRGVLICKEDA